jgi:hypothetical protein
MIFGIKDAANLTIKKKSDGSVFLYTPYSNVTTNEWSADSVYTKAKGVNSIRWDTGRTGSFKADMENFDLKVLAMLAGNDWVIGSTEVLKREKLTVDATNKITLTQTPVAGSLSVFTLESDMVSHKEEMESGTPATTPKTYSLSGKDVTLNATTCPAGTEMVVYYMYLTGETAKQLKFTFDKYPESFEIFADSMLREKETGVDSFIQIHYPNCKPQSNFTITMDSASPTNLSITFDLFPNGDGDMATYTTIE